MNLISHISIMPIDSRYSSTAEDFPAPPREVGDATRAQAYLDALQEDVGDVKLVPKTGGR